MKRWPIKPLGELVDFIGGGTPRRDRPDYWGGEIPWASVKDLQSQSLETTLENITAKGLANSASNLIPKGTVIIASRIGLGKVAVNLKPVAINQDLKALTPRSSDLFPRYLLLFLLSKAEYFERAGVGATVKGLTIADYQKLNIILPPLTEQERIVKLLDEANELRQLCVQADRRTAALIPSLFHDMFGDPISNPHEWTRATLADACTKIADGTHFSPPPTEMGVPYVTAKHLRDYGLDFERDPTFVSADAHREIYARCDPKPGDVLYIKDGATTGLAAINRYDFEFSMLSSLALLRPSPSKCNSEFLCEWLNNKRVKAAMLEQMAGAAIRRLTLVKIKKASVLLPPLSLQKKFAAHVSDIRTMETGQTTSRHRLENLFQSMLHRAFQGEL